MTRSSLTGLILAAAAAVPLAGCGGGGMSTFMCTASGSASQFVANALTVPASKSEFAIDIDGDGQPDNALGRIVAALNSQSLMTQQGVDTAVMDGSVVLLLSETASSTSSADCAEAKVQVGMKAAMPPKFDGSDMFTVDSTVGGGDFLGQIASSTFTSLPSPVTSSKPYTVTLQLPLVSGAAPVQLNITAGQIKFTNASGGLMKGQINGAIKSTDVQNNIIPNVATLLTNKVAMDPTSSTNMQILSLFDDGGEPDPSGTCKNADGTGSCKNPDGSCGMKGDKVIQTCEVATNSIIKGVLAPDVQLFDANGNYKPTPHGTMKDSLSLGLGFTAVKATF